MFDSTSIFWLLLGLGAGVGFGWLSAKLRNQKRITELSTILEIEQTNSADFAQTFEALSDRALRQNNQSFFELANEKLEPLQKTLEQFDCKVQEIEKARAGAYAGVTQQISGLLAAQSELRTQTVDLVTAKCCNLSQDRLRGSISPVFLTEQKHLRYDRAEEPAGEPRRQLSHGHDLHAVFASARRGDADHMPGKFCVNDNGSAFGASRVHHFPSAAYIAGPRHVPDWLREMNVEVRTEIKEVSKPRLYSCANPQHQAVEAFRWMRALLASGTPPEEIAITAASPADFDDHVLALSREANIPVHFVHGISAVTERDGQITAALAETIVKGISQGRVRRLFALLQVSSPALRDLPPGWMRILPADAPLTAVERWEQMFARSVPADWPDGIDRSAAVLEVLRLLAKGSQAADEIGEKLLNGVPLTLWRRALDDGPAEALPVTLTRQHVEDGLEPASNVIWASAVTLASSPRAHVRLLALNAGRWPRRISEDRLIPDPAHIGKHVGFSVDALKAQSHAPSSRSRKYCL